MSEDGNSGRGEITYADAGDSTRLCAISAFPFRSGRWTANFPFNAIYTEWAAISIGATPSRPALAISSGSGHRGGDGFGFDCSAHSRIDTC